METSYDSITEARRREILKELLHSQTWDKFLSVKYPSVKRYCGEGAESLLTFFSTLFELTASGKNTITKITIKECLKPGTDYV